MFAATEELTSGASQANADDRAIVILLVDDDPDTRMLIHETISQCKVTNRVYEVANGQEALDFLNHRGAYINAPRPGLIYLDIEMPGLDGQETLKRIKADPRLRDIPVVMMTGVTDEEQMRQAMINGANSYTIKPNSAELFFKTILEASSYWLTVHQTPRPITGN